MVPVVAVVPAKLAIQIPTWKLPVVAVVPVEAVVAVVPVLAVVEVKLQKTTNLWCQWNL